MIFVITGNGKGKTTSALGTAVRAAGWGKPVAVVFFDKGGSHYGENRILKKIQEIDVFRFGLKRFDPAASLGTGEKSKTFRFENTEKDRKEAEAALKKVRKLYNKDYFLIVADELINGLNLDLLDELAVRDLINECPNDVHLILTGRNAPDWLIEKADLVSDVNEIKHYFRDGESAIKGLDY